MPRPPASKDYQQQQQQQHPLPPHQQQQRHPSPPHHHHQQQQQQQQQHQPRHFNPNPNPRRPYANRSNYNKNRGPRNSSEVGRGGSYHPNQNQQHQHPQPHPPLHPDYPDAIEFDYACGQPSRSPGSGDNGNGFHHYTLPSFFEDGFHIRNDGGGSDFGGHHFFNNHNNHHHHFHHVQSLPPIDPWQAINKLIEFRFDMIGPIRLQNDHFQRSKSSLLFDPNCGQVSTIIESVIHYYTQQVVLMVNGQFRGAQLPIPFAQHICVALDDGHSRYEEVIRMESTKYVGVPDIIGQTADLQSVYSRLRCGDMKRRPKFRDGLRQSLDQMRLGIKNTPYEIIVSRPTGRALAMDRTILSFFTENTSEFELHLQPIIQHILTPINFHLSGAPYQIVGHFYRPLLTHAALIIRSGDEQLLDTVTIAASILEERIHSTSYDTAIGTRICDDERKVEGFRVIDAVSYFEVGSESWGPNLTVYNPRISAFCNPFVNLSMNPVLNKNFDVYRTPTFIPPAIPALNQFNDYRQHCRFVPITALQPPPPSPFFHLHPSELGPVLRGNGQCHGHAHAHAHAQKPKLNAMADEFYPVGHEAKEKEPTDPQNSSEETKLAGSESSSPAPAPESPPTLVLAAHGLEFHVPQVAILIAHPPISGPDEYYVSEMQSDSEDYYEPGKKSDPSSEADVDADPNDGVDGDDQHNDSQEEIVVSVALLTLDSSEPPSPSSSPETETPSPSSVSLNDCKYSNSCSWSEEVENQEQYPI